MHRISAVILFCAALCSRVAAQASLSFEVYERYPGHAVATKVDPAEAYSLAMMHVQSQLSGTIAACIAWTKREVSISAEPGFQTVRSRLDTECRNMRPAEKEITLHAIDVIKHYLIEALNEAGWQAQDVVTGENATVANHPGPFRPLMFCNDLFAAKLQVDPNSEVGKLTADSIKYYSDKATGNANNDKLLVLYSKAMFRLQASQTISIRVDVNSPYLKAPAGSGGRYRVIILPRTGFAYEVTHSTGDALEVPKTEVCVLLGNWAGADMNSGQYAGYPYKHRQPAPVFETASIRFEGTAAAIEAVLKKINWEKVNEMLTN